MIVLDTNVMSVLMRRDGDPIAVGWLDRQPPESIWITAVTIFELQFGLELLAQGRRRRQLEDEFARALDEDFEGRILPFEQTAAREAASIAARGVRLAALSRSAMRRSPGSPQPGARRWQPATALRRARDHAGRPVGRDLGD